MVESAENIDGQSARFLTTHWNVVLQAGQQDAPDAMDALEKLCRAYWYPLYAYVRRKGHSPHDAQDLTQEFFSRFLEKRYLSLADQSRGKFRTFLLTSMQHFLVNEWAKNQTARRGGGQRLISWDEDDAENRYLAEPVGEMAPDEIFEKRWAASLLEQTLSELRKNYAALGKGELFEVLKDFVWGEKANATYQEIGNSIGLSEGAVKVAVHRLRQRYKDLLRAKVAETVSSEDEVDDELRRLIAAFST